MATLGFTTVIKKHQDNVLSLLCSSTTTAAILDSKIGWLRADNVALMASTTTCVQAGGSCFSLERLYEIAHAKEKKARQLFAKEPLMTAATDTAMAMSSITDTDKFATVSSWGVGSSSPPPKQRPQSCSPLRPGDNIKQIDPFDDRFPTSFPPLGGRAPALLVDTGNLSDPDQQKLLEELMVLASPCKALIVWAGQDRHTKNTPQGNITQDPDDAKYPSLPSSLISPFVGDQEDLDTHIGNPALRKPTNKVFTLAKPR
jgi:hypothetical protein